MAIGRIVDLSTPCKLWGGPVDVDGYGIKPRGNKNGHNLHASRWVWEREIGAIPEGMHVHHVCRVKLCVELAHLELKDPSTHKKEHIAEDGLSGMAAIHAAATTCAQGHPFDSHNGKQRICLTCKRKRGREYMRRKNGVKNPRVA